MTAFALVPVNLERGRLGLPSRALSQWAGVPVLTHTLNRLARVDGLQGIVLVHPAGQDVPGLLPKITPAARIRCFAHEPARDLLAPARLSARKWGLTAWRGGLGGMTIFDELLPAGPLLAAAQEVKADAVLLAGADWPLVDPYWCSQVLARHRDQPEAMPMTFSQAPPGMAGVALGLKMLEQLAQSQMTFGRLLAYSPSKPQPDSIGRDVCVQVPGDIRSCRDRLIYDTPRACGLMDELARRYGPAVTDMDALAVAHDVADIMAQRPLGFGRLPQQITLELTPRRPVTGPITPQHYVKLDRDFMPPELAQHILAQVATEPDAAVLLGGLGDALLHPHWWDIAQAARAAGVFGLGLETDLLCELPEIDRLLELDLDVVSVRLNADTAKTYESVMGQDAFAQVIHNLEHLINARNHRTVELEKTAPSALDHQFARPWVAPRLIKTADTLADMEMFFDKWMHFTGHAVIEPATTGCGLMPALGPVNMAPGRRFPCRQLHRRMTILSSGRVALCDQDWLGRVILGDANTTPLVEIMEHQREIASQHQTGAWADLELCVSCQEWHRP